MYLYLLLHGWLSGRCVCNLCAHLVEKNINLFVNVQDSMLNAG